MIEDRTPSVPRTVKNLIDGHWRQSEVGDVTTRTNPADLREVVATSPNSTPKDVDDAIAAACRAFDSWSRQPLEVRMDLIMRALTVLDRRREELARVDVLESGKTMRECASEVARTLDTVRYQVDVAPRALRDEAEARSGVVPRLDHCPVGVSAVITPWNFPFSVVLRKIVPALLPGNAVVVKPAELTPVTAAIIGEAFTEAGLPTGVLNIVFGSGARIGGSLVTDERVKAISFTGSTSVGLVINRDATHDVRIQLEMGGKNATVIAADADIARAVDGVQSAAFTAAGQWCVATSRVLVQSSVFDEVVERLVAKARTIRVGNGLDLDVDMGAIVSQAQLDKVLAYLASTSPETARIMAGGQRLDEPPLDHGLFVMPTIVGVDDPTCPLWQDEVFGPVLSVMRYETLDDAIALVNGTPYGLAASIYTRDTAAASQFCAGADVGRVAVNLPTNAGDPRIAGTGWKSSGRGAPEGAAEGIRFYTHPKAVFVGQQ